MPHHVGGLAGEGRVPAVGQDPPETGFESE